MYYLPMHGVVKAESSTTKLRIVFDASVKTSNGQSLNNILLTSPSSALSYLQVQGSLNCYYQRHLQDIPGHGTDLHRFLYQEK